MTTTIEPDRHRTGHSERRNHRRRSAPARRVLLVWDAQPGHGFRLDPRRPADRRAPAALRRPWAAGCSAAPPRSPRRRSHRHAAGEPRPRCSPTSPPAAPTWCDPGSRRCVTSGFAVFAKTQGGRRTATWTATCSPTSRCAAGRAWRHCWWHPPTVRRSGSPGRNRPGRRHPGGRGRISRTCQLGVSVGYLGVRRPGRHPGCVPGAATANRPGFAAGAGGVAAAVPAAVRAADIRELDNRTDDAPWRKWAPKSQDGYADWEPGVRLVGSNGVPIPIHRDRCHGRTVPGWRRVRQPASGSMSPRAVSLTRAAVGRRVGARRRGVRA